LRSVIQAPTGSLQSGHEPCSLSAEAGTVLSMAKVTINPAMLNWALVDSARTAADLAEATGRDLATVQQWLSGDAMPVGKDVTAFCKLLGRSPQFFRLPTPPKARTYAARFRTAPGKASVERTPGEINALRAAYRIQKVAKWAKDESEAPAFPELSDSPSLAADELRVWLSWETSTQVNASSKGALFRSLRAAVEERGVIVLLRDAGEKSCRGFSLPDETAPLALVNSKYKYPSVRSYTLIHELAHLANEQEFVCHDLDTKTERWCNRIAANFLMPGKHVSLYVEKHLGGYVLDGDTDSVRKLAYRYKTSWEAAAIRLKELGFAGDGLVQTVKNTAEESGPAFSTTPRTTPIIRLDEYGSTYTRIVLDALEENRLSSLDARRYLNVSGTQLASVSQLLKGA
jgi:Zn-dependent peptidase ImmA (M78 family)